MKNWLILILSIAILAGCKKGEDDPFFSIYTRKARLTGEWTAASGTGNYVYDDPAASHGINHTETYDYNLFVNTITNVTSGNTTTYNRDLTVRYVFNKDKTVRFEWVEERTVGPSSYTHHAVKEGTWAWKAANGKSKAAVNLSFTTVTIMENCTGCDTTTTEYSQETAPTLVLELQRLANEEIMMSFSGDNSSGEITDVANWSFRLLKD